MTKLAAEAVDRFAASIPGCVFRLKTWGFIVHADVLRGAPKLVVAWHEPPAVSSMPPERLEVAPGTGKIELRRFVVDNEGEEVGAAYAEDALAAAHLAHEWGFWLEVQRRTAEEARS